MPLTRRTESNTVFLQVKHYCLWRELKAPVTGCETLEVPNPKTGHKVTKHGFRYDTLEAFVAKIVKYDTGSKYATRYFGFKMHMVDSGQTFVLDMPYQSQFLRRFLRVAPNVDWDIPLSITIFKGKKKDGVSAGSEETGVWFQQRGETIKPFFTRDNPNGMPEAFQDPDTKEWDFKAQHRWLIAHLQEETIPQIEEAAAGRVAPQDLEQSADYGIEQPHTDDGIPMAEGITDDDCPF